jgi:transcriptional regulator with XRE-family HTH domain
MRKIITHLRESAGVSQAELAHRLPFTASRVSRLESGEIELTEEDAQQISDAIGSDTAKEFGEYLRQNWRILEKPGFYHLSRKTLWEAECSLQRLDDLKDDPELKNAFLQQVNSCRLGLERSADFLHSTEHPVTFFGRPGIGKTTVICTLSDLRKPGENLNQQMVLQTGSGRTTVCEVHVRNGSEYAIVTDPCSTEELRQYVDDFCEHLMRIVNGKGGDGGVEGAGISAEAERALRNMTRLTIKKIKGADGKSKSEDPALEMAQQCRTPEDLQIQIMSRLDLARRNRTSISRPRESTVSGLDWLARTSAEINYGRHPEFSLPRRVEIAVPSPILGAENLDLTLIDTRGIDEPAVPRRDLQGYLDDERAVNIFCSGFNDAPDAATQALIERAIAGGLREVMTEKGVLLVLPQGEQESAVRDNGTGDTVSDAEEGREIRRDQVATTLDHLGTGALTVEFLNVQNESDHDNLRRALLTAVLRIRARHEQQIRTLVSSVERLIANKASEQAKAVFEAAIHPLRVWFASNRVLPQAKQRVDASLLADIDGLRYASSLRASINRHGNWSNFDYWHALGFGTRTETSARSAELITGLRAVVTNALNDPEFADVHDFIRHFRDQIETGLVQLFQEVETLGEAAFLDQLTKDSAYWNQCYNRWGGGPGYKNDIRHWTGEWFSKAERIDRYEFVEQEIQRRWQDLIRKFDEQLASAAPVDEAAAA